MRVVRIVEDAPGRAAARSRSARARIDRDRVHVSQIDHDPVFAGAEARHAVSSSADGEIEAVVAGEIDCGRHVRRCGGAHDHARAPLDHRIQHLPRLVVGLVAGFDDLSRYTALQLLDGHLRDHHIPPSLSYAADRAVLHDRDGSGKEELPKLNQA